MAVGLSRGKKTRVWEDAKNWKDRVEKLWRGRAKDVDSIGGVAKVGEGQRLETWELSLFSCGA